MNEHKEIQAYLQNIQKRFAEGHATEHTFRGDLQNLIEALHGDLTVTNEPKRIKCGAPDYILTRKKIPIGYIEAKDLGANLKDKAYREQFDRYKKSLANLAFTDYLTFDFYRSGTATETVSLAHIDGKKIVPNPDQFQKITDLLKDFCLQVSQSITSSKHLADMMAGKARLMANIIHEALDSDIESNENNDLKNQMEAFKEVLIHDLTPKGFADIYAQTITYGLFAARLYDTTLEDFSRQEAAELLPKSNPFLRKLFHHIAGPDLDDRIVWIVDDLADIFCATDIREILQSFEHKDGGKDPIIHFYENFLASYDKSMRKK